MEKAIYNCFFEADEKKLRPFIEPTKQLIEKINKHIDK